jgi:hypothetical protein
MPSRRQLRLSALVAIALGLGALFPLHAAGDVKARQADSFVDSIGVNIHTPFSDTPYVSDFEGVRGRLDELGVRHVRDVLFPDRPDQYERLDELAAAGIGTTLVIGSPAEPAGTREGLLEIAADDLEGIDALEGPNEYSTYTPFDPEWKAHLITYQRALYEEAKADPALASLPVVGPSIVHNDQAALGDIAADLDFGNIHSYPFGNPPDKLGAAIAKAEFNSGPKPIMATETGYHTALKWEGEHPPVDEATMATYMPRLFLEYFRWGIVRTFSYELLDEFPDPDGEDSESNFGLVRHDLTPKPAFEALRNAIRIFEDPGPSFTPGALDYTLSEGGVEIAGPESTGLHKVLLQKRDGSFYLALWRTSSVWDPATGQAVAAPAQPLEITIAPGLESATEYLPNSAAAPVWSMTRPTQPLQLQVGPEVVFLRLVPGEPAAEEPAPAPPSPPQGEPSPGPAGGQNGTQGGDQGTAPDPEPRVPSCVVPKLRERKLNVARTQLREAACKLGEVSGPRVRSSRVVAQHPRPGRALAAGSTVDVKLGPR